MLYVYLGRYTASIAASDYGTDVSDDVNIIFVYEQSHKVVSLQLVIALSDEFTIRYCFNKTFLCGSSTCAIVRQLSIRLCYVPIVYRYVVTVCFMVGSTPCTLLWRSTLYCVSKL